MALAPRKHRHWFAIHRHPNWHGHCRRSHRSLRESVTTHSCRRWHFHTPYSHAHEATS